MTPRCMKPGPHWHRLPNGNLSEHLHGPARDVIRYIDQLEALVS